MLTTFLLSLECCKNVVSLSPAKVGTKIRDIQTAQAMDKLIAEGDTRNFIERKRAARDMVKNTTHEAKTDCLRDLLLSGGIPAEARDEAEKLFSLWRPPVVSTTTDPVVVVFKGAGTMFRYSGPWSRVQSPSVELLIQGVDCWESTSSTTKEDTMEVIFSNIVVALRFVPTQARRVDTDVFIVVLWPLHSCFAQ